MRHRLRACLLAAALAACDRSPSGDAPPAATGPASASSGSVADAASAAPYEPHAVVFQEKAMGVDFIFTTYPRQARDERILDLRMRAAFNEVARIEGLFSATREESDLRKVHAAAGQGPVPVSPEVFTVIAKGLALSEATDGAFDVTSGPLRLLWNFGSVDPKVPSVRELDQARKRVSWKKVELVRERRSVFLEEEGMKLNVSRLSRGYAIDAAARSFARDKIDAFIIRAGSDLFVRGKTLDGKPHRLEIRDPRGESPSDGFGTLEVIDAAFSTTGDYERSFVKGEKRYHGVIDPRTGMPATGARSVSVVARDALTATGLSEALLALGPAKGMKLVESTEGCAAVIVGSKNEVLVSERAKTSFDQTRAPTDGP